MIKKKPYWVSKRASYPFGNSVRQLVLIKGEKAMNTPLNVMIKKLKLNKDFRYARSYDGKEVLLERIKRS